MSIISGYQKIKKMMKTASGYQLLSHWTSSNTVEMNDGTTLEQRISNVDNTSDQDKPISTAQQNALDQKADIASPDLTGTPTAPTPLSGTNTDQIATTAFVQTAVSNATNNTKAIETPKANGTAAVGTSAKYAREDHVHPLQTSVSGSSGSCTGNAATATKATNDSDGNKISDTYFKKSGGTVTGDTTFSGKAKATQLIIGTTAISEIGGMWITT